MGDGGVSAAFPYLNHKMPEKIAANYLAPPKPLEFSELYSPRAEVPTAINGQSLQKSFWRTRDDLTFGLYEWRSKGWMIVTCRDTAPKGSVYRTILLDLRKLYFELEAKARGDREPLLRKRDKTLADDAQLHKAAAAFILARLTVGTEELPWPTTFAAPAAAAAAAAAAADAVDAVAAAAGATVTAAEEPVTATAVAKEKMAVFSLLSGDSEVLELPCSLLEGQPGLEAVDPLTLKLRPTPAPGPGAETAPAVAAPAGEPVVAPVAGERDGTLPKLPASPAPSPDKPKGAATPAAVPKSTGAGKLPSIAAASPPDKGKAKAAAPQSSKKPK